MSTLLLKDFAFGTLDCLRSLESAIKNATLSAVPEYNFESGLGLSIWHSTHQSLVKTMEVWANQSLFRQLSGRIMDDELHIWL